MNPDTIGCVWTGEFDLNTLRVDGEIFESGKKKLRFQKYPDTCGQGLSGKKNTSRVRAASEKDILLATRTSNSYLQSKV